LLEGILIAGHATLTTTAYIYMRVEFHEQFHILQKALDEAYAAGWFGRNIQGSGYSLECYIHRGAGAYICGEETGLIESLEGKRGQPRIKPPFPAVEGLFHKPTVVNNVETLCCLPHIIERGSDWFTSLGPPHSTGPKLFCVSGPVKRPGCYEGIMDITVRDLVYGEQFGGGMLDGKELKAVMPGGVSMGIITADEIDCKLDFENPRNYGLLGLGTAAAVAIDTDTDMRDVLYNICRFFGTESCGQCTHCREGAAWAMRIADRLRKGAGRKEDLDILVDVANNMGMMPGMNICGLSDGAAYPIRMIVEKFRAEFEDHIRNQKPGRVQEVLETLR
jgi:NADH-quinone oxidoreductase subunit F